MMLRTFSRSLIVAVVVTVMGGLGMAAKPAQAQGYGFAVATPGIPVNITGGYAYPGAFGYPGGYGYVSGYGYRHAGGAGFHGGYGRNYYGHHHRPLVVVAPVAPVYGRRPPVVAVARPLPW
jgi:hypothetical protein